MRKLLILLLSLLLLVGCEVDIEDQESCESKGGEWVEYTYTTTMLVGKVVVPMTQVGYKCEYEN